MMQDYMIKLDGFRDWCHISIDTIGGRIIFKGITIDERPDIVTGWLAQRFECGEIYKSDTLSPKRNIRAHDIVTVK